MPSLTIRSETGATVKIELRNGLNTLGRSPSSDFPIEDSSISAQHCVIVLETNGILVRDLDSTNGTFIEGRRIKDGTLHEGQVLRLGDVELVWERTVDRVAIPLVESTPAPAPVVMLDGAIACLNHAASRATYCCPHCQQRFCTFCVHHMRRVGGKTHNLCPVCSTECEFIGDHQEKKKPLLGRIKEVVGALLKAGTGK